MKTITINIPTSFHEVDFEKISSRNVRASFGNCEGYGINRSYAFDDLVNNMPNGEQPEQHPQFPNGFSNWHETHYFISSHIAESEDNEGSMANRRRLEHGIGGLWELAKELTDEFETLHKGREWDGEWMDELEVWLNKKDERRPLRLEGAGNADRRPSAQHSWKR